MKPCERTGESFIVAGKAAEDLEVPPKSTTFNPNQPPLSSGLKFGGKLTGTDMV
jgi:hypothetical protein